MFSGFHKRTADGTSVQERRRICVAGTWAGVRIQAQGRVCPSPAGKPVLPCPGRAAAEGHRVATGDTGRMEKTRGSGRGARLPSLPFSPCRPCQSSPGSGGPAPRHGGPCVQHREHLRTGPGEPTFRLVAWRALLAPAGVKTSVPRRPVGSSLVQGDTPFPAWPTSSDRLTKPPCETGQLRGYPGLRARLPPSPISFPGCGAGSTPHECTLVSSSELASWGPRSQHWRLFHRPENNSTHFQNFVQNSLLGMVQLLIVDGSY